MLGGVDWEITQVHSVTDGDTVRVHRQRTENLDDSCAHTIFDRPDVYPRGVPVRLIIIDTPERNEPQAWRQARDDVIQWLADVPPIVTLHVMTWADGGFSRFLGDIYYVYAGQRYSLSEWMLRERGWPSYLG